MNLSLFEEPQSFDREALRRKLSELAEQRIYIGTSSWKYEGWFGQIYTRDRYLSRGRYSAKRFAEECLNEYAETFPIVCGDFSFYQFPTPAFWQRLFGSAPATLRYVFKVPEEVTAKCFPSHPRYGPRAGEDNAGFLDAALLQSEFLDPLRPYKDRIAVLVFEFGTFGKRTYADVAQFIAEIEPFLALLPRDFRYAIEVRNEEFLAPEYFACLREHGVAHVFNAWTRMPPISEQVQLAEAFTSDYTVVRALLRRGRPYETAVSQFTPYDHLQDPNPETRQTIRELIGRAQKRNEPAYIFVNNRLEGNAPATIESL